MNDQRRGMLLILAAAALWGTTGTAQALGPGTSDPLGVGLVRLLVAAPALWVLAAVTGRRSLGAWRSYPIGPVVVASVAMAVYQPAFFSAVDRTGVAVGTVVAIGSAPILTGVLAWMFDQQRPSARWYSATVLAVVGVALLATSGGGSGTIDVVGVAFAVLAGASYAAYVVASMRLVRHGPAVLSMAVVFSVAALLLSPLLVFVDVSWVSTGRGVAMVVHLGVMATAVAYALFASGLRATPASTAATLTLGEPLTATLLGVMVLGERPTLGAWIGACLIAAGLLLTAVVRRRAPALEPV